MFVNGENKKKNIEMKFSLLNSIFHSANKSERTSEKNRLFYIQFYIHRFGMCTTVYYSYMVMLMFILFLKRTVPDADGCLILNYLFNVQIKIKSNLKFKFDFLLYSSLMLLLII